MHFELWHGMCQALTRDKLHKTRIKETTGLICTPAAVKGIGLRMSEVSDSLDASDLLSMTRDGNKKQTRKCLLPLFSVAWHFLSSIEILASKCS